MKVWGLILAVTMAVAGFHADAAKRMGGGKSVGKQSSNVTQRDAAPSAPAAAPGAQNAAKPAAPAAAGAAAAAPKRPWGAMLGGLAAGLGLAWLASSLGLGEAFGNILMFGLLALGVMMAIGFFMRKRAAGQSGNQTGAQNRSPFAFEGASSGGSGGGGSVATAPGGAPIASPAQYSPANVGNDSSARPWERSAGVPLETGRPHSTGAGGSIIGSAIGSQISGSTPPSTWSIPEGFDTASFLAAAKGNFVSLQAAWDKSDIPALRAMMTDDMLTEIRSQLSERESHTGGSANHTEVVMIEAQLLGIEDLGQDYMASVEFSGMIKEDPATGPSPFREVWNMTKPKDGRLGWLVAGVQALQ
jgi:predicted lipid-binding transport protein (Tim44 family)